MSRSTNLSRLFWPAISPTAACRRRPNRRPKPVWSSGSRSAARPCGRRFRIWSQNLVERGLVEVRRGKGTFVAQPKITQELTDLTGFVEDMQALGRTPSARLLDKPIVAADETVPHHLALAPGTLVVRLRHVRLTDSVGMSSDQNCRPAPSPSSLAANRRPPSSARSSTRRPHASLPNFSLPAGVDPSELMAASGLGHLARRQAGGRAAVNLRIHTSLHNRDYSWSGVTSVFRFVCWSWVLSAAEKSGPGSKTCRSSTAMGTHLLGSRLLCVAWSSHACLASAIADC